MKKFLVKISYTLLPLWLAIIGLVCFYYLIIEPNMQGDLGRLGKIPAKLFYERDSDKTIKDIYYPTIHKIDSLKADSFDVITCGDSFSQQGLKGFQNYMALNGVTVINYRPNGPLAWNAFQAAFDLMNLGYVDSTNAKMIIVETVERSLCNRLLGLDCSHVELCEEDEKPSKSTSNWSLSEAKTYLDLQLGIKESPMKQLELNKQLFSGTHGRFLYFYYEDIEEGGFTIPQESYSKMQSNIDTLFSIASEKGVELIVLVCPDKYDLYQNYVNNNPYPRKTINEDFRTVVGNREEIVIGKEILLPYIDRGEKDIYYLDDTHWSYKSAKIIADTLTNLYTKKGL